MLAVCGLTVLLHPSPRPTGGCLLMPPCVTSSLRFVLMRRVTARSTTPLLLWIRTRSTPSVARTAVCCPEL